MAEYRIYRMYTSGGDDGSYEVGGPNRGWSKLKRILVLLLVLFAINLALTGGGEIRRGLTWWVLFVPAMLLSLTLHEWAHAAMADFLGDPTARRLGRKSLNPMRHLDLVGTLMLLFAGFGWAKPVPVDSSNFKQPERAMVSVSLAGPLANLFLAFLAALLLRGTVTLAMGLKEPVAWTGWVVAFGKIMVQMNLALMFFNLIPLPPLDGSKILMPLLARSQKIWLRQNETFCQMLLFLLLAFGFIGGPLFRAVTWGTGLLYNLVGIDPMVQLYL